MKRILILLFALGILASAFSLVDAAGRDKIIGTIDLVNEPLHAGETSQFHVVLEKRVTRPMIAIWCYQGSEARAQHCILPDYYRGYDEVAQCGAFPRATWGFDPSQPINCAAVAYEETYGDRNPYAVTQWIEFEVLPAR